MPCIRTALNDGIFVWPTITKISLWVTKYSISRLRPLQITAASLSTERVEGGIGLSQLDPVGGVVSMNKITFLKTEHMIWGNVCVCVCCNKKHIVYVHVHADES